MPYITSSRRGYVCPLSDEAPNNAGDLNFQFTMLIKQYMAVYGLNYQTINDVIGALEGAKLEFYRRVAAPYEDTKIAENSDVY